MNHSILIKNKSKNDQRKIMDLLVQVFELNYSKIVQYLPFTQHHRVKLICRGIYYLSVTNDIWFGLRVEVVDKKMENFEDIDFVEEEPKIATKEQKQIRIHSLKKNNPTNKLRQASNVKQKKMTLSTINNQMPFRSTEMGFKRLLKTNTVNKSKATSSKQTQHYLLDLIDIPQGWGKKDLIIDVKDPWALNVHRTNNLCTVVKRWNQFHHKITTEMKEVEKDLNSLVKKCIRIDKQLTEYLKKFEQQIYVLLKQILAGSQQKLLIDDQLNKLGRIFITHHLEMVAIASSFEAFISKTHDCCVKISKCQNTQRQTTWVIEYISILQQLIDQYLKIHTKSPQLFKYLSKSLFEIVDILIEDFGAVEVEINGQMVEVASVGLVHISKKSQFFEVMYESLENCTGGMLKIGQRGEEENLGINLISGKFKNLKAISHHLWNISKYFSKLVKQLEAKEKKGGMSKQTAIIRNFFISYEENSMPLLDWKNPQRVQKQVSELKQKVGNLKGMMHGND